MRSSTFLRHVLFVCLVIIGLCSIIATGGPGESGGSGGSGGNSAPGSTPTGPFLSTDIGGTWSLVEGPSTTYGSLGISTAGVVTGGSWTQIGVGSGTYTGGTVSVNSDGLISGSMIKSNGDIIIVADGQMSLDKDLLIYAATGTIGDDEAGIALNGGGSYTTTDLAGTWIWGAPNSYGTFVVNSSGTITGGTYTETGVGSGTVTGGALAITAQGAISGSVATSTSTFTIQSGQMNSDKNVIYLAGAPTPPIATGAIVAIQQSGSFTSGTDLAGTYTFVSIASISSIAYGSITVNSAGSVTAGSWTEIANGIVTGSGTYTSGTLFLSTQGVIAGGTSTSDGEAHSVQSGQLNDSQTVALIVDTNNSSVTTMSVWVRTP